MTPLGSNGVAGGGTRSGTGVTASDFTHPRAFPGRAFLAPQDGRPGGRHRPRPSNPEAPVAHTPPTRPLSPVPPRARGCSFSTRRPSSRSSCGRDRARADEGERTHGASYRNGGTQARANALLPTTGRSLHAGDSLHSSIPLPSQFDFLNQHAKRRTAEAGRRVRKSWCSNSGWGRNRTLTVRVIRPRHTYHASF